MLIARGGPSRQQKMLNEMTPAQCRGARALLGMTQPELARKAGLGLSTIVDFEKVRRHVSREAIAAIQAALSRAGVEFIGENGGGLGVRLRKRGRSKISGQHDQ
jgi:transcriptional regulator with XRE-family HTH domain